jgi:hypothetical protein
MGRAWWATWKPLGLACVLTVTLALARLALRPSEWIAPTLLTFPMAVVIACAQRYADVRLPTFWIMLFQFPAYALALIAAARSNRLKRGAIAIASMHFAAVVAGGPWSWGPSLESFSRRLRDTAGADARECGIVGLADPSSNAIACARDASKTGASFSVGFQEMGIDSRIYVGLARPSGGAASIIHWDSDTWGGGNLVPLRRLYQRHCANPSISEEEGRPRVACDPVGE